MAKEKIFETNEEELGKVLESTGVWWDAFEEAHKPKTLSLEELLMGGDEPNENDANSTFVFGKTYTKKKKKLSKNEKRKERKEKSLRKKMEKEALDRAINTLNNGAIITFESLEKVTPEERFYGHVELFQNFLLRCACIINGMPVYKYKQGIGYKKDLSENYCRIRRIDMGFIFKESDLGWADTASMPEVDVDSEEFRYRFTTLLISNTINRLYNVAFNMVGKCKKSDKYVKANEALKKIRLNYKKLIYSVLDGDLPYSVRMARFVEDFGYTGMPLKRYETSLGTMKVYDRNCFITNKFAEVKWRCKHDISMVMDSDAGDTTMYEIMLYAFRMSTDDFQGTHCKIFDTLDHKIYTDDIPEAIKFLGKAIRKAWKRQGCDTLMKIPPVASAFFGSNVEMSIDHEYNEYADDADFIRGFKAMEMLKFMFKDTNVTRVVDMMITHCPEMEIRYALIA